MPAKASASAKGAPAARRGRKPRQERWQEILATAAQVFFEKGYDATSLQDIADRTGILKGSIYYYIRTKSDLLDHLFQEAHRRGMENIEPIANSDADPLARLAGMIAAHTAYVCRDRALSAVYIHESKHLTPELRQKIFGDAHGYRQLFQRVIEEGQQQGLIDPGLDAKLSALCLLGALNSVYRWYREDGGFSVDAISAHLAAGALGGIATATGRAVLAKPGPAS